MEAIRWRVGGLRRLKNGENPLEIVVGREVDRDASPLPTLLDRDLRAKDAFESVLEFSKVRRNGSSG